MSLYDVNNGTGNKSDLNQLVDALSGQNDVGAIQAYAQIAPPGSLTAAVNATSGNLNGTYQYAVAFITGYWQGPNGSGTLHTQGNTGGGTTSNAVSPSGGQQVNLSAIPIGGMGVVARAIYRTKANSSTLFFLQQINDNVTTAWTDNVADSALGAAMPTTNTTGSYFSGDGHGLMNVTPADNSVSDTKIGNRTADPTQAPSGLVGTLTQWLSWITNRIKAITGTTNWYDAPPTTLTAAEAHMTNTNNPHSVTAAQVGAIPTTAEGQAGGVATLDSNSRVVQKANSAVSADSANAAPWAGITGTPTTVAGYGITDAVKTSQIGAANGVAGLDGNKQVPANQLGNVPPVNPATGSALGTVELPASAGAPSTPVATYRANSIKEYLLADTNLDNVLSFTPAAAGNFLVAVSVRVVTATTNVTIQITWTDASGTVQTDVRCSNTNLGVGSHDVPVKFINANPNAITIQVQAGTANQVYVSAAVVGV